MDTRIKIRCCVAMLAAVLCGRQALAQCQLAPLLPDLQASAFAPSTTSVLAGQVISFSADACNVGTWGTAELWEDAVWFNSSPTLSGATRLGTFCKNFPFSILLGQCYSTFPGGLTAGTVTIPSVAPFGPAWLGFQVNAGYSGCPFPTVCTPSWFYPEANYDNNVLWVQIHVDARADLEVTALSAVPSRAAFGTAVDIAVNVTNRGGSIGLGSVAVALYVSPTPSPTGTPLVTQPPLPLVTVPSGATIPLTTRITAPSIAAGCYYLVAVVDPFGTVQELEEANNTRAVELCIGPAAAVSAFGVGCSYAGGTPPGIAARGTPFLGSRMELVATGLPPFSWVMFAFGASRTIWQGVPLPFDLTQIGMPGCAVLVSMEAVVMVPNGAGQQIEFPTHIPDHQALLGAHVYAQLFVTDPRAMPLGVVASAGLDLELGY